MHLPGTVTWTLMSSHTQQPAQAKGLLSTTVRSRRVDLVPRSSFFFNCQKTVAIEQSSHAVSGDTCTSNTILTWLLLIYCYEIAKRSKKKKIMKKQIYSRQLLYLGLKTKSLPMKELVLLNYETDHWLDVFRNYAYF